ncbi:MAG: porin, partial [Roseinatronobacter sp.]
MKKLLLATTALTLSAGVAAADVALSGNARMGVVYDGEDFGFNSRLRVQFTLSGETDGGLAFGGSIRADNADGAGGGNVDTGGMTQGSVFISGEFGRLSMGDVAGAAEFIAGDLAGVGVTGLRFLNENTFLSNADRAAARYDYSIEGFTFALSADEPRASDTYAVAVGYTFEGFGAGVGYEHAGSGLNHIIGYASASFEGVNIKATYGRASSDLVAAQGFDSRNQYGLSVSGSFDDVTVTAFGRRDFDSNTHYGLG